MVLRGVGGGEGHRKHQGGGVHSSSCMAVDV